MSATIAAPTTRYTLASLSEAVIALLAKADAADALLDEYAATLPQVSADDLLEQCAADQADAANDLADAYAMRGPQSAGMFRDGAGRVYVVKLGEFGLYANLVEGKTRTYVRGAIHTLFETGRLTVDECEALSLHSGTCCFCNRALKVKESVLLGMGPVCRKRVMGG